MRTLYRSSFFCIIWFAFIGLGLSLKYPVDISIKSVQRAISVQSRVAKWLFTFVSLSETNLYLTENTHVEVQLTTKMNLIDPTANGSQILPPSYFCVYDEAQYNAVTNSRAFQFADRYAMPCTERRFISPNGTFSAKFYLRKSGLYKPFLMARLSPDYEWKIMGDMSFRNPDGSFLAVNEMPYISLYTGLLISFCFLLAYCVWETHLEGYKNIVQWMMVVTVLGYITSCALYLSYFTDGNRTGVMNTSYKNAAGVIETFADCTLFLMLAVCSLGWTIIDRSIPQREKIVFVVIASVYLLLGGLEQLPDSFVNGFASLIKVFLRITIAFVLNITINATVLRFRGRTLAQEREKMDKSYAIELVTNYYKLDLLYYLRRSIAPFLLAQTVFLFLQVFYLSETQLWIGNMINNIVTILYLGDLNRRFGVRKLNIAVQGQKPGPSTSDMLTVHVFIEPLYFSNEGTGFGVALFVVVNYLEHLAVFRSQRRPANRTGPENTTENTTTENTTAPQDNQR